MQKVSEIKSLTGIRGFAILLVLFGHASYWNFNLHPYLDFRGSGRYGVFIFFVLSSFLLTRQFIEADIRKGETPGFVKHYLFRRVLRIYPLFIAALAVYYFFYKIGYPIGKVDEIMFIKSIFLIDAEGIFWTVPVEFQYYFFLPLVWLLVKKWRIEFIIFFTVIFTYFWSLIYPPEYTTNILPFISIFLIGSVSAFVYKYLENILISGSSAVNWEKVFGILSILSFFSFIILIPNFYNMIFSGNIGRVYFHKHFVLFAVLSSVFIISTSLSNGLLKKIMESSFFILWGKISFSAYLGHIIIYRIIYHIYFHFPSIHKVVYVLLFLLLTGMFSFLSYRLFEAPISKLQSLADIRKHLFETFHKKRKHI